jgi:hypothetical protein
MPDNCRIKPRVNVHKVAVLKELGGKPRARRTLTERGLSRRDVTEPLRPSHQRVEQLLEAS